MKFNVAEAVNKLDGLGKALFFGGLVFAVGFALVNLFSGSIVGFGVGVAATLFVLWISGVITVGKSTETPVDTNVEGAVEKIVAETEKPAKKTKKKTTTKKPKKAKEVVAPENDTPTAV